MATLFEKPSGNGKAWGIAFKCEVQRKRIVISFSQEQYTKRTAEKMKEVVEVLIRNRKNHIPLLDKHTERWINDADENLKGKLAAAGLIELLEIHTCEELWDSFLKWKMKRVSDSTLGTYYAAQRRFYGFFKKNEYIDKLTTERFEKFQEFLGESLAEASVAGTFKQIHALFKWAIKKKWLNNHPLTGIPKLNFTNAEKDILVPAQVYTRLLEYCPCQQWRVILALARYGGMRPGEILILRWDDINWADDFITVKSPKTKRHEGKDKRFPPIFPEVYEELSTLFHQGENEGQEYVISRYKGNAKFNVGTEFHRITKKAGYPKIERPFDNMRMTRSNEVREKFGEFCEMMWIGHSRQVAKKHYYKVLPKEIKNAAKWVSCNPEEDESGDNVPNRPTRSMPKQETQNEDSTEEKSNHDDHTD